MQAASNCTIAPQRLEHGVVVRRVATSRGGQRLAPGLGALTPDSFNASMPRTAAIRSALASWRYRIERIPLHQLASWSRSSAAAGQAFAVVDLAGVGAYRSSASAAAERRCGAPPARCRRRPGYPAASAPEVGRVRPRLHGHGRPPGRVAPRSRATVAGLPLIQAAPRVDRAAWCSRAPSSHEKTARPATRPQRGRCRTPAGDPVRRTTPASPRALPRASCSASTRIDLFGTNFAGRAPRSWHGTQPAAK